MGAPVDTPPLPGAAGNQVPAPPPTTPSPTQTIAFQNTVFAIYSFVETEIVEL